MTNQEKFIQIFGIDVWQQMIVFSGLAEQFKEYWTSPYNDKAESEDNECMFSDYPDMPYQYDNMTGSMNL